MGRALGPLVAAAISLVGALAATLYLHRQASEVLAHALDARLVAVGQSAALFLAGQQPTDQKLAALASAHSLDGAYVIDPSLTLVADSTGASGQANLLRIDAPRATAAFGGAPSIGRAYRLGDLGVQTAYFPLRAPDGKVQALLGLEAGEAFAAPARGLTRARNIALLLALVGALALAVVAARGARLEQARRVADAKAARAEAVGTLAAMAAHEIRNPLGIIRGNVELMRERAGPALSERDKSALADVLDEVQRLRQLTDDLLDLSGDRPMASEEVPLLTVLADVASAVGAAYPGLSIRCDATELPVVKGDRSRLRQVFLNLVQNAAQAQGSGVVLLSAVAGDRQVAVRVVDEGPGISPELQARLFEPFATTKAKGAGLGLVVSRRLVERHGGTLKQVPAKKGATFEVVLPREPKEGGR